MVIEPQVRKPLGACPSTTDFKSAFPVRYSDVGRIDPKGHFSEEYDDRTGGQASSKMHMKVDGAFARKNGAV
ncbi:BQ5605_C002g01474 [Microbotryum silenes-dioicae]|uniref:BQ5605_C002g01474 protein n=1 Tax=Microbotryum silenes-dioicae TaxID=796604 RepID=A0A2X0NWE0_9BASI|nr:BQ5605_C002g01474 [Microbotryum silenes-dioicae]